jgi:hypothetical protein
MIRTVKPQTINMAGTKVIAAPQSFSTYRGAFRHRCGVSVVYG